VAVRGEPPSYRVYLLRSWEVRSADADGPVAWRFSLEDPQTGERKGFGDLESLVAFLRARTVLQLSADSQPAQDSVSTGADPVSQHQGEEHPEDNLQPG
jgi:hypothetical protein